MHRVIEILCHNSIYNLLLSYHLVDVDTEGALINRFYLLSDGSVLYLFMF
jgi:hypothetical protein